MTLVIFIRFEHQHPKGIFKGVGDDASAHAFFLNIQLYYWELADIQMEISIFAYI